MKTSTMKIIVVIITMMTHFSRAAKAAPGTDAGGIRTDFGDVMIENVGIGTSYNLRDIAGKPLKITNTGKSTVDLLIDSQIPSESLVTKERKELGYKPVPSVDWVTISQNQFVVPSGESAYTDVIIKIPNDPALYGKKFQASIYSRTTGKGMIHLGVWSHLLLTIIKSPEAQAEQEKNRKTGIVGNLDYTLLPDRLSLLNVPIGKPFDIAKEVKRTIKLANSGDQPVTLRVKSIPLGDSPLGLQEGFEIPDTTWLHISSDTFTVDPSSFVDPGFVLDLPNRPDLKNKKLMFVIKVEPADAAIVGITYYGRIYVETTGGSK
jgi:hypothetical protein